MLLNVQILTRRLLFNRYGTTRLIKKDNIILGSIAASPSKCNRTSFWFCSCGFHVWCSSATHWGCCRWRLPRCLRETRLDFQASQNYCISLATSRFSFRSSADCFPYFCRQWHILCQRLKKRWLFGWGTRPACWPVPSECRLATWVQFCSGWTAMDPAEWNFSIRLHRESSTDFL